MHSNDSALGNPSVRVDDIEDRRADIADLGRLLEAQKNAGLLELSEATSCRRVRDIEPVSCVGDPDDRKAWLTPRTPVTGTIRPGDLPLNSEVSTPASWLRPFSSTGRRVKFSANNFNATPEMQILLNRSVRGFLNGFAVLLRAKMLSASAPRESDHANPDSSNAC